MTCGNKNYNPNQKMMDELGLISHVQIIMNNIKSNDEWYSQMIEKSKEWGFQSTQF